MKLLTILLGYLFIITIIAGTVGYFNISVAKEEIIIENTKKIVKKP